MGGDIKKVTNKSDVGIGLTRKKRAQALLKRQATNLK
jgi:hypothetical protein